MKSVKGTQTEKNLLASFAGEAQARNRYTFYAKVAVEEGYQQIAAIFMETAEQERVHAKRMFKYLEGGMVEITASYPAGVIASTLDNLKEAVEGEHEEAFDLYPKFAEDAEREGFPAIAAMYRHIAEVEKVHEARYQAFWENVKENRVFERQEEQEWQCRHCGYVAKGKSAPATCPACLHPQAYFEIRKINY